MNLQEYLKVKEYTYNEYCEYLLSKYGPVPCDYMTPLFAKDPKSSRINSRTAEGLVIHHIKEDRAILLSSPLDARLYPYEFQKKENLVYCDYLEHLLLHVLIHKYPYDPGNAFVGVGGMYNYIIPDINEIYDGTNFTPWKRGCYKRIKDDKNVYFKMLDQLYELEKSIDPDEEDRFVFARFERCGMRSNTFIDYLSYRGENEWVLQIKEYRNNHREENKMAIIPKKKTITHISYSRSEYDSDQINEIEKGIKYGLLEEQIQTYLDSNLSWDQMYEIRLGFVYGLSKNKVLLYADNTIPSEIMYQIRKDLQTSNLSDDEIRSKYHLKSIPKPIKEDVDYTEINSQNGLFAIIDTETTWANEVMSIGLVIVNGDDFSVCETRYYILEPECKYPAIYSGSLKIIDDYITVSRDQALKEITMCLSKANINDIFAFFSDFDKRHLPELSSFRWHGIEKIAIYNQYNEKIKDMDCYASGRLKRNYGVESILQLLTGDESYHETHNALQDALDELQIMKLLKHSHLIYPIT